MESADAKARPSSFDSLMKDLRAVQGVQFLKDNNEQNKKKQELADYKAKAIEIEEKVTSYRRKKHVNLLSKVAEIEARMEVVRRGKKVKSFSIPASSMVDLQNAQSHSLDSEDVCSNPSTASAVDSLQELLQSKSLSASSLSHSQSELQKNVASLNALHAQEAQLEEWYKGMSNELATQQMHLAQKFEEMKLNILQQKQQRLKDSHNFINQLSVESKRSVASPPVNSICCSSNSTATVETVTKPRRSLERHLQSSPLPSKSAFDKSNSPNEVKIPRSTSNSPSCVDVTTALDSCASSTPTKQPQRPRSAIGSDRDYFLVSNGNKPTMPTRAAPFRSGRVLDKASLKLVACVKGHLTRELYKSGKVQTLVKTFKDSHLYLHEILTENKSTSSLVAKQQLTRRVEEEIAMTREKFHDAFFSLSVPDQVRVIRHSREVLQKNHEVHQAQLDDSISKKLSTVSKRTMKRRQISADNLENIRPESADGKPKLRKTWSTRVLHPIPGKFSPKVKEKATTTGNKQRPSTPVRQSPATGRMSPASDVANKLPREALGTRRTLAAKFDKHIRPVVT